MGVFGDFLLGIAVGLLATSASIAWGLKLNDKERNSFWFWWGFVLSRVWDTLRF